jgi:cyclopropane fatty-acyl-phospholipid synthase-like methyltransferase
MWGWGGGGGSGDEVGWGCGWGAGRSGAVEAVGGDVVEQTLDAHQTPGQLRQMMD